MPFPTVCKRWVSRFLNRRRLTHYRKTVEQERPACDADLLRGCQYTLSFVVLVVYSLIQYLVSCHYFIPLDGG